MKKLAIPTIKTRSDNGPRYVAPVRRQLPQKLFRYVEIPDNKRGSSHVSMVAVNTDDERRNALGMMAGRMISAVTVYEADLNAPKVWSDQFNADVIPRRAVAVLRLESPPPTQPEEVFVWIDTGRDALELGAKTRARADREGRVMTAPKHKWRHRGHADTGGIYRSSAACMRCGLVCIWEGPTQGTFAWLAGDSTTTRRFERNGVAEPWTARCPEGTEGVQ